MNYVCQVQLVFSESSCGTFIGFEWMNSIESSFRIAKDGLFCTYNAAIILDCACHSSVSIDNNRVPSFDEDSAWHDEQLKDSVIEVAVHILNERILNMIGWDELKAGQQMFAY